MLYYTVCRINSFFDRLLFNSFIITLRSNIGCKTFNSSSWVVDNGMTCWTFVSFVALLLTVFTGKLTPSTTSLLTISVSVAIDVVLSNYISMATLFTAIRKGTSLKLLSLQNPNAGCNSSQWNFNLFMQPIDLFFLAFI